MGKPGLILENQFGEVSINQVSANQDQYTEAGSYQTFGPDLYLASDSGSDDDGDPKFLATIMGNLIGEDMENEGNYYGGVIGAFSLTGTNGTEYPSGAVLGIIMSEVTVADGAFVAVIDGDSGVTKAGAAFKARMLNSTVGSGFDYGLDLYDPAFGSFHPLAILKADLRLTNEVCLLNGSGVPDATVGAGYAGPGSIYVRTTTGKLYVNGGSKATPDWKIVTSA